MYIKYMQSLLTSELVAFEDTWTVETSIGVSGVDPCVGGAHEHTWWGRVGGLAPAFPPGQVKLTHPHSGPEGLNRCTPPLHRYLATITCHTRRGEI
jgi:hypothetical protein